MHHELRSGDPRLTNAIKRSEPTYHCIVRLRTPTGSDSEEFQIIGDFRERAAVVAATLADKNDSTLPADWRERIVQAQDSHLVLGTYQRGIEIGALDLKRIGQIAENTGFHQYQNSNGYQPMTRETLMKWFRRQYADQLLSTGFCGTSLKAEIPDDTQFAKIMTEVGDVYDRYASFPVDTLLVTRNRPFPYAIARKSADIFQLPHVTGAVYRYNGVSLTVADFGVQLTGVDNDCAPHMFKNPVLRADFRKFAMHLGVDTFAISSKYEEDFIDKTLETLEPFETIWVQNSPKLPLNVKPGREYDWNPTKEEFAHVIKRELYLR